MLVPVTQLIGMRISSSTLSTPTCARPRAPPPDSARPMRGAGSEAVCATTGARAAMPARNTPARVNRVRRIIATPLVPAGAALQDDMMRTRDRGR